MLTASVRSDDAERARRGTPQLAATYGPTTLAEIYFLDDGRLSFRAPPGAYAGVAAWHSADAWIDAALNHPALVATATAHRVAVSTFLRVVRHLAPYAEAATGRDIAVAHSTIADQMGCCTKTVQRACRMAEALGLLVRILDGRDMSLSQRMAVLGHYSRGTQGIKWRSLPNFYAAAMPKDVSVRASRRTLAKPVRGDRYAGDVDNLRSHTVAQKLNVHLPVGSSVRSETPYISWVTTNTFGPLCGQRTQRPPQKADRTVAPLPQKAQRKEGVRAPQPLEPEVEGWMRALRSTMVGYRNVSLHRLHNGVLCFVRAGLSTAQVRQGLDRYLAATGHTWITMWNHDQADEQAKYLVAMLTRARRAGYIPLNDSGDGCRPDSS